MPGANHNNILNFGKDNLYRNIDNFIRSLTPSSQPNSDDNLSCYDLSSKKEVDINNNKISNDSKNMIETEKKIDNDINKINNNITSHDELTSLQKVKDNNNNKCFNKSISNKEF